MSAPTKADLITLGPDLSDLSAEDEELLKDILAQLGDRDGSSRHGESQRQREQLGSSEPSTEGEPIIVTTTVDSADEEEEEEAQLHRHKKSQPHLSPPFIPSPLTKPYPSPPKSQIPPLNTPTPLPKSPTPQPKSPTPLLNTATPSHKSHTPQPKSPIPLPKTPTPPPKSPSSPPIIPTSPPKSPTPPSPISTEFVANLENSFIGWAQASQPALSLTLEPSTSTLIPKPKPKCTATSTKPSSSQQSIPRAAAV